MLFAYRTSFCHVLSAHWYLAIVCFPGLTAQTSEKGGDSVAEKINGVMEEAREQEPHHNTTEGTASVIDRVGRNPGTGPFCWSQVWLAVYYTLVT